ncbi:YhbD family protein [Methanobacterium sp.]|uniref:YhbD family protein n=1 Tax=Methanobacterium sp. TaxID=2164 RepID=UPI002ABA7600|nr:YhbD family protein [Methanobacterium sp.]MDY9924090.1 YhbD family protein [Methanobacterium sp.]
MVEDLISKKELLKVTGISYGQLYRWKRKNLIPEEWFIKKSTFTGQETFFPKARIMDRIKKIKSMKGDVSLDDLADMFSPNLMERVLESGKLVEQNIVSKTTMDFYTQKRGEVEKFAFEKMLYLYILDKMFESGKINFEEGEIILKLLEGEYTKFKGNGGELLFLRKLGISSCCLVSSVCDIYFENSMKIIEKVNLSDLIEELKIKIA